MEKTENRETEISKVISRLDKSIQILGKEIEETTERLSIVLRNIPRSDGESNEGGKLAEFNTPLAQNISDLEFRVSLANNRLAELRSRIEL